VEAVAVSKGLETERTQQVLETARLDRALLVFKNSRAVLGALKMGI